MMKMSRGLFITLEGPDGCGKTTQALALERELTQEGKRVLLTREPGGTKLGEAVREMLLSPESGLMSPRTEMLLYAASRAQHVDEIIRPQLAAGACVISDRFIDSSLVYQGIGLSLGVAEVLAVNLAATGGLMPDLTIVLCLDAPQARERLHKKLKQGRMAIDRIESRDLAYQEKVAAGYRSICQMFPERVVLIDANAAPESITRGIMNQIHQLERGERP
ncbi:MAG: Thymidylate kinase [Firmicutes bacterium]|nr:Thymidylate kinase [Bacillota bacterium]